MSLDGILKSVYFNEGIHDLLTDALADKKTLREHPFRKFVEYQRNAYADAGLDIKTEGFQIGDTIGGDISKARAAFISINPGFNPYEDFPRYHAGTKIISMPDGTELDFNDVKKFFRDRFQKAVIGSDGKTLKIKCQSKGKRNRSVAVHFWGCVRNSVESLWKDAKVGISAKELMAKAVCVDVVPFKSKKEIGVSESLNFCLKNFTRHILPSIAAPVIVLIGKRVRQAFFDFAVASYKEWESAAKAFAEYKPYLYKGDLFQGEKLVIAVDFNQGGFSLASHCKNQDTLAALQDAL